MVIPTDPASPPGPPLDGFGGMAYVHDSVRWTSYAEEQDGFWLFEPASPRPDSAPVVVFTHGYGAINPMVYGGWIRHLVRRGAVVIFPRYQQNLLVPGAGKFAENVATGIRQGLDTLMYGPGRVRPDTSQMLFIGHSYGGAISAFLGVHYADYQLPQPKALLLCAPGTGPLTATRLDSYEGLPADLQLVIVSSTEDRVVTEDFQYRIFETAVQTPQRVFIRQFADPYGAPVISAQHNECYSLDEAFDSGLRNGTVQRGLVNAKTDAVDYFGYWKLGDALLAQLQHNPAAIDSMVDTTWIQSLGVWSDGTPIRSLEVTLPESAGER